MSVSPIPEISAERAMEILSAYGAQPSRWPEQQRDALIALVAASPELAAVARQEQALDSLLDHYQPATRLTAGALTNYLPASDARRRPPTRWRALIASLSSSDDFQGGWQAAAMVMLPLTLGFVLGLSTEVTPEDWSDTEYLVFSPESGDLSSE